MSTTSTELVVPAVGGDDARTRREVFEVVRDLAAEELGFVERGLVDEHRNPLCLDALHDALDRGRAEVVASRLIGGLLDANGLETNVPT